VSEMDIRILHWHGICPNCKKLSCIYMDFDTDGDGLKMQCGFICDSCNWQLSEKEFKAIELIDAECCNGICTPKLIEFVELGGERK